MRRTALLGPILALGLVACKEATGPTVDQDSRPGVPALESVTYDLIGTGKVMFQRIGGLGQYEAVYLVDGAARRSSPVLVGAPIIVWGASISPAGNQVAWRRRNPAPEGCYSVYLTNFTGDSLRRLSSGFQCNSEDEPSWTPSGSGVVFPVGPSDIERSGLYLRVLATDELTRLPNAEGCFEFGPVSVSVRGGLAYACGTRILLADSASQRVTLAYQTSSPEARVYFPAFAPDGGRIAFLELLRDVSGVVVSTTLRYLELPGRAVRTVVSVPGSGGALWVGADNPVSLCWLPDGSRVVFTAPLTGTPADRPLRTNVYVVNADGTGLTRLTSASDAYDYNVSCSR